MWLNKGDLTLWHSLFTSLHRLRVLSVVQKLSILGKASLSVERFPSHPKNFVSAFLQAFSGWLLICSPNKCKIECLYIFHHYVVLVERAFKRNPLWTDDDFFVHGVNEKNVSCEVLRVTCIMWKYISCCPIFTLQAQNHLHKRRKGRGAKALEEHDTRMSLIFSIFWSLFKLLPMFSATLLSIYTLWSLVMAE